MGSGPHRCGLGQRAAEPGRPRLRLQPPEPRARRRAARGRTADVACPAAGPRPRRLGRSVQPAVPHRRACRRVGHGPRRRRPASDRAARRRLRRVHHGPARLPHALVGRPAGGEVRPPRARHHGGGDLPPRRGRHGAAAAHDQLRAVLRLPRACGGAAGAAAPYPTWTRRRAPNAGPFAVQHARRRVRDCGGPRRRDAAAEPTDGRAGPDARRSDRTRAGGDRRRADRAAVLVRAARVGRDPGRRAGGHDLGPAVGC